MVNLVRENYKTYINSTILKLTPEKGYLHQEQRIVEIN